MKTIKRFATVGSAILSVAALTTISHAAEWSTAATADSFQIENEAIFATASEQTAITLLCMNGKLRAAISTSGIEGQDILSVNSETRRRINRDVTLEIEGKDPHKATWRVNPSADIHVTPGRKEAAMLYNATVSQKPVSLQRKGKDVHEFVLPAPNNIFAEFGAACGVGKNAEKQS